MKENVILKCKQYIKPTTVTTILLHVRFNTKGDFSKIQSLLILKLTKQCGENKVVKL